MTTTAESCDYVHNTLGVIAPRIYWVQLGYTCYDNQSVGCHLTDENGDELLILGIGATGSRDEKAIIWAIAERQRRKEERTRSTAMAREADGLKALAESIRQTTDEQFLARLLGKVSEKTAYAIRAQLRTNPL